jgi:sugar phosphate isomerase/epimerase
LFKGERSGFQVLYVSEWLSRWMVRRKKILTIEQLASVVKEQGWDGIAISGKRPLTSVLDRNLEEWKAFRSLCDSLGLEISC